MLKAAREAKVRTSWINPDEEYEKALESFVASSLKNQAFLQDLTGTAARLAHLGFLDQGFKRLLHHFRSHHGLIPLHHHHNVHRVAQLRFNLEHGFSTAVRAAFVAGLDRSKIDVVYPGIALDDYRAMQVDSTTTRPLTIGFLARFVPEKGLHLLVDAFIRLYRSGEFPNLRLIAGGYVSRAYKTYLDGIRRKIKDNGLEDRISLLGTLERGDKLNFFKQIDVFSVPAPYREPKGISILEALASGVPVVQPDHGAYPEWIHATQGGLLHRPHDSSDLAEKLAILLRDAGLRKQLGQQGRQGIFEKFSSERMTSGTLEIFQQLVSKSQEVQKLPLEVVQ